MKQKVSSEITRKIDEAITACLEKKKQDLFSAITLAKLGASPVVIEKLLYLSLKEGGMSYLKKILEIASRKLKLGERMIFVEACLKKGYTDESVTDIVEYGGGKEEIDELILFCIKKSDGGLRLHDAVRAATKTRKASQQVVEKLIKALISEGSYCSIVELANLNKRNLTPAEIDVCVRIAISKEYYEDAIKIASNGASKKMIDDLALLLLSKFKKGQTGWTGENNIQVLFRSGVSQWIIEDFIEMCLEKDSTWRYAAEAVIEFDVDQALIDKTVEACLKSSNIHSKEMAVLVTKKGASVAAADNLLRYLIKMGSISYAIEVLDYLKRQPSIEEVEEITQYVLEKIKRS